MSKQHRIPAIVRAAIKIARKYGMTEELLAWEIKEIKHDQFAGKTWVAAVFENTERCYCIFDRVTPDDGVGHAAYVPCLMQCWCMGHRVCLSDDTDEILFGGPDHVAMMEAAQASQS